MNNHKDKIIITSYNQKKLIIKLIMHEKDMSTKYHGRDARRNGAKGCSIKLAEF